MDVADKGWIAKSRGGGGSVKGNKGGGKANNPKYGAMHQFLGKVNMASGNGPTKVKK